MTDHAVVDQATPAGIATPAVAPTIPPDSAPALPPVSSASLPRTFGPIVPHRVPARPPLVAPSMPRLAPRLPERFGQRPGDALMTPITAQPLNAPVREFAPRLAAPGRAAVQASTAPPVAQAAPGLGLRDAEQRDARQRRRVRILLVGGAVVLALGTIFIPPAVEAWLAPEPVVPAPSHIDR